MRVRDAALIRKLCSLGLPPQALVQSLLPALRELIPAHSGGVFWVDRDFQMTALYAERLLPAEAMAAYYESHYRDAVAGFSVAFAMRASRSDPVSSHSFSAAEQATPYFAEILRPLDAFHVLYGIVRHDSMPFAQVSLYRGASDASFGRRDEGCLRDLLGYLSRGLHAAEVTRSPVDRSVVVEECLGIVTDKGDIVRAPDEWRHLVRLAALQAVSPSEARRERDRMREFLRGVLDSAQLPGGRLRSCEVVRQTSWGRFDVRVFPLGDAPAERERHVGVLVRREEPRTLALVRGAGSSALSPQQREVALLLAAGKTNAEISAALGLTLNTTSYHIKQIYARLGVNDRHAVEETLLRLART
jgi:DNA-binding CsgD family transcriptional regulator